jgi:hypothetical protein
MTHPKPSTSPSGRSASLLHWIPRALLFVVFWISLFKFPEYIFGLGPDESYEQPLGYFFKHHAQAGVDYMFTYGPLGFFYSRAYEPDLFWHKYFWEVIVKAAFALLAVAVVARQSDTASKVLFSLVFVLFMVTDPYGMQDAFFPYFVLCLGLLAFEEQRPHGAERDPTRSLSQQGSLTRFGSVNEMLCLILMGVLSWVKFTFFILAVVYVLIIVAYRLYGRSYLGALRSLALFTASLLAAWVAAGQALGHLPDYLYSSFELARGHSEGLAIPGDPWRAVWALGVAGLIVALTPFLDWRSTSKARRVAYLAMFGAGMFFQWKYGFVRPDHHTIGYFAYAMCIPFLLFMTFPAVEAPATERMVTLRLGPVQSKPVPLSVFRRRARLVLTAAALCLAAPTLFVPKGQTQDSYAMMMSYRGRFTDNLKKLVDPQGAKETYDSQRSAYAGAGPLRRVQAAVGKASIDMLYSDQGWIFAHGLRWQPRPVFQGYICYTPYLLEANAKFYRSEKAPDYVLLHWLQIDYHFPTSEESQTLFELLKRYEPVLVEGTGFVLLKRSNRSVDVADSGDRIVREQTARFDESVDISDISDRYQTISIKIRPTLWGRLRTFFFKSPPVYVRFTTDSGVAFYRLVPAMAEEEFLLNPFVRSVQDLLFLYADALPSRVKSFQIWVDERGPASYTNEIQIRLKSRAKLIGNPLSRQKIEEMLRAGRNEEE